MPAKNVREGEWVGHAHQFRETHEYAAFLGFVSLRFLISYVFFCSNGCHVSGFLRRLSASAYIPQTDEEKIKFWLKTKTHANGRVDAANGQVLVAKEFSIVTHRNQKKGKMTATRRRGERAKLAALKAAKAAQVAMLPDILDSITNL